MSQTAAVTPTPLATPLMGLATLMGMAYAGDDLTALGAELLDRVREHPQDANALMDLCTIFQLKFNPRSALALQAQALVLQQCYHLGTAEPAQIRLLALMAPGELSGNTPLEFLVAGSDISLDMLYVAPHLPVPETLPEHDLLFVAVAQSEHNAPVLSYLEPLLKAWPRPVLNPPGCIARLSRTGVWERLQGAPGVVMPACGRMARGVLEQLARGERAIASVLEATDFPLIIRPIDSHAGKGLTRLDDASALRDYLITMDQPEFYVSSFVDYRGPDGLFRKYRIALIGARPFACHMAISEHWMVHYLNADMTESIQKRAEEAHFMATFDQEFALAHQEAWTAVAERLDLDYVLLDCARTPNGQLLIFEADSAAVVHAMDPVDVFAYKQPQMRKVFDAFHQLLATKLQGQAAKST